MLGSFILTIIKQVFQVQKTTFKFLDNVGPNQTLAIDSIAAYLTKQPILETNGEMIRNLEHDEYSYDASQFFQKCL